MTGIPVLESYLNKDNCAYPAYGVEAALNHVKTTYGVEEYIAEDIISLQGEYRFPGVFTSIKNTADSLLSLFYE